MSVVAGSPPIRGWTDHIFATECDPARIESFLAHDRSRPATRSDVVLVADATRTFLAVNAKISTTLVEHYAAGPSASRTTAVKRLHEEIRTALENWGDENFDTFLQGSYRNNTAVADINDVDIVALHDPSRSPMSSMKWEALFAKVAYCLDNSAYTSGRVELGDKCVKLHGPIDADIVPAVGTSPFSYEDPVIVYSRRESTERANYPRTHYASGVKKQADTGGAYKGTVRLFKRWASQYSVLPAPSYYLECAVHSVDAGQFDSYLPMSFVNVGLELCGYTSTTRIPSVAGDRDVLLPGDWPWSDFQRVQQRLLGDLRFAVEAIRASTQSEADRKWKLAFGD